jgi:hypothetical protein
LETEVGERKQVDSRPVLRKIEETSPSQLSILKGSGNVKSLYEV